jgi:signal peptidase
MKNTWKITSTILIIAFIIIGGLTYFAPRFGWRVDTVLSGSMEPTLKVGGIVITRPVPFDDIKEGDIITYLAPSDNKLTSHRVNSISGSFLLGFATKGDANEQPDPYLVPMEAVVGKVVFTLPYIGYVTNFIKTPAGFLVLLGIPGIIVIIMEIRNIWCVLYGRDRKKNTILVGDTKR